eukprot:6197269-Pleurochrysis_carterae.AAC.2
MFSPTRCKRYPDWARQLVRLGDEGIASLLLYRRFLWGFTRALAFSACRAVSASCCSGANSLSLGPLRVAFLALASVFWGSRSVVTLSFVGAGIVTASLEKAATYLLTTTTTRTTIPVDEQQNEVITADLHAQTVK